MGGHTISHCNEFHDLAFWARQLTKPSQRLIKSGYKKRQKKKEREEGGKKKEKEKKKKNYHGSI